MNPKVDFYFNKATRFQDAMSKLRSVILDCGLTEELKWGVPCYQYDKKNIVLIHVFKEYCALLFFKGALLNDPQGLLIQQTKNVQAARQLRFTDAKETGKLKTTIKAYIYEAIEVEKAGLKVELKKTDAYEISAEFEKKLKASKALNTAFYALTPGRQRGYILHFSAAKQSATREARIEKSLRFILKGKGINDK